MFDDSRPFETWLVAWRDQSPDLELMRGANPAIVPRNYLVDAALNAASRQRDYSQFHKLLDALKNPYDRRLEYADMRQLPPKDFGPFVTYCGT